MARLLLSDSIKGKLRHPAKFTNSLIPEIAKILIQHNAKLVLDPFAGTGKIAEIKKHGFNGEIHCVEIEQEWSLMHEYDVDKWFVADSENLYWAANESYDAIAYSPTYGNRMADHYNETTQTLRFTYRHCLGRKLSDGNTGKMQWGNAYREKHEKIYKELYRVLKKHGVWIINIADHIRNKKRVYVSEWHANTIENLGMKQIDKITISTPKLKVGRNKEVRIGEEYIYVFVKE